MQRRFGGLVLSLEVGHSAPPGRSSAPCPGVLLEAQGGVEHMGSDAASGSSGLHYREKGENRECKNCWSVDELWVSFVFSGCALQC